MPEPRMPKVWELSVQEAEAVLAAAGISYRIALAQNYTIPEGMLLSVAPAPGTVIEPDAEAVLTVSCGPPVVSEQE